MITIPNYRPSPVFVYNGRQFAPTYPPTSKPMMDDLVATRHDNVSSSGANKQSVFERIEQFRNLEFSQILMEEAMEFAAMYRYILQGNSFQYHPDGFNSNLIAAEQYDFAHANWSKVNSAVVADQTVDPDGTILADKFNELAGAGVHSIHRTHGTPASGENWCWSTCVKAAERTAIYLETINRANVTMRSHFNLSAESVAIQDAGHTAELLKIGNGWYRVGVKYNQGSGATTAVARIGLCDPANIANTNYTGVASNGVYLYAAVWEKGTKITLPFDTWTLDNDDFTPKFAMKGISKLTMRMRKV